MSDEEKVSHFEILLNKPDNPVYVSGEVISGVVELRVSERLKINSIQLSLHGKAQVQW
jgi:hypothetical protein